MAQRSPALLKPAGYQEGLVTLSGAEPDDTNRRVKETLYRGYRFPLEIIQLTV